MAQVYDLGYKKLFSNKKLFRQLIESFFQEIDWMQDIDYEQVELLDKLFISEEYKKRESDIIYKVHFKSEAGYRDDAYIVILLENQSKSHPFMALRVAHYITSFYMKLIEADSKLTLLPPVFPIVLYNGAQNWTAAESIEELIEHHDLLGDYGFQFKYFKLAENEIPVELLKELGNSVAALFLGEIHGFESLAGAFSKLLKTEDMQVISLLLNYFEQLFRHNKMDQVDWNELDRMRNREEVNMFLETIKAQEKQAFQQGKQEGLQQGKQEGKQEAWQQSKLEIAKAMLFKDLEINLIAELTELSIDKIEQLKKDLTH
ncbi:Rpn family recombination-promoting nuclease/putative transposase [Candidatus Albibeggiatoa sp. nov. BB20]|uniref:Rpn family recombination-promoting nuclease/putative transposase n=1 Tax=Candidatus Albibeggiatoa sp. nov. BB20 TaxID=3162723 RepID=UPI0033658301